MIYTGMKDPLDIYKSKEGVLGQDQHASAWTNAAEGDRKTEKGFQGLKSFNPLLAFTQKCNARKCSRTPLQTMIAPPFMALCTMPASIPNHFSFYIASFPF